ncbi:MAG TPA: GNAT family N-acetyltransferase [Spirochaetia bacterium]|nr:GNAT family N-acetyltransferase [Spirochaetia bacterium]
MTYQLRDFRIEDYEKAYELWESSEGIGLSAADSRENIAVFLEHNPGLSFVAVPASAAGAGAGSPELLGAVLASCDGRRGFLYHLAVARSARGQGIGRALVDRSLAALAGAGVRKCHLFVARDNPAGKRFWEKAGWEERTTLFVMSHDVRA